MNVQKIMDKLPEKFLPEQAGETRAVFQFHFDDDPPYYLSILEGDCQVCQGHHDDPDVTLIMASETFVQIIRGELGATMAFFSGRLRAEGNVMLASRLGDYFDR